MKKLIFLFSLACFMFTSCSEEPSSSGVSNMDELASGLSFDSSGGGAAGGGASGGGATGGGAAAGLITAGEWNDLENWDYWTNLMGIETSEEMQKLWGMNPIRRFSFELRGSDGSRAKDIKVSLMHSNIEIWNARTDNKGTAELWLEPWTISTEINPNDLEVWINDGEEKFTEFKSIEEGVNIFEIASQDETNRGAEISFIVDATGSMSDELEFLKNELLDVIRRVESEHGSTLINTSAVFYRDEGDEYVTKNSEWSSDATETVNFITEQSAGGGGDFPEAVHSALNVAFMNLEWSTLATNKMCFLLLDAPPHGDQEVVAQIKESISFAAERGIKIIPITASGINKETEFLMRFMSVLTNGTYVFITNDSGIGGDHIEATVGDYEVEFLNDLMVRLIGEYLE